MPFLFQIAENFFLHFDDKPLLALTLINLILVLSINYLTRTFDYAFAIKIESKLAHRRA